LILISNCSVIVTLDGILISPNIVVTTLKKILNASNFVVISFSDGILWSEDHVSETEGAIWISDNGGVHTDDWVVVAAHDVVGSTHIIVWSLDDVVSSSSCISRGSSRESSALLAESWPEIVLLSLGWVPSVLHILEEFALKVEGGLTELDGCRSHCLDD